MSKTADKRLQRRIEHAEYLWEQAQLKAATIQSALDYAVDQFNQHRQELPEDIANQTKEMIETRQNEIKDFLMKEKDLYLQRMGAVPGVKLS